MEETKEWQALVQTLSQYLDVDQRLTLGHHLAEAFREVRRETWDEGWAAAWSPLAMHGLNDGPNPYR